MPAHYKDNTIEQVRNQFVDLLIRQDFVTDKSGVKLLEIPGAQFVASKETIFDEVNYDYVGREIAWYESQSLKVDDIPGGPPAIWKAVSSKNGSINSNYGFLIGSPFNGHQYTQVLKELLTSPTSRRAVMIYTRPTMHVEYNQDGMSDFICTNAVQYLLRDGFLDVVVQMRSNDVRFGYRNDRAWQLHVQTKLIEDLNKAYQAPAYIDRAPVVRGDIYWQVGSLHVYEKDFYLVDNYYETGAPSITKAAYRERKPNSPWSK
jgi:thymidylate synthase